MKALKFVLLGIVGWTGIARAALHPFHQRNVELRAILTHPHVAKAVQTTADGSGLIDGIEFDVLVAGRGAPSYGQYSVRSGDCELEVHVQYINKPGDPPGAARFEVKVPRPIVCPKK